MIYFCEECGQRHNLENEITGIENSIICTGCHEKIILPDKKMGKKMSKKMIKKSVLQESMTDLKQGDPEIQDLYKLMIVDDSKLIRGAIRRIFQDQDNVVVVGEAKNGKEALEILPELDPDVITMDVNMPVMDGLTTLKHIMIKHPRPTIMLSTLTKEGSSVTFDALKFGAIDFMLKPSRLTNQDMEKQYENIISKVVMAANVQIEDVKYLRTPGKIKKRNNHSACEFLVILGASEGGYSSLLKIIPHLRPDLPVAFLAVIYADLECVDAFSEYLDQHSMIKVKRAKDKQPLEAGVCYFCSGQEYVTVISLGNKYCLQVYPAPFNKRRGAINMLMFSVAEIMKEDVAGVILSGNGNDGVEGIKEILRNRGTAVVQDPQSCLCKEMANAAIEKCKTDLVISDIMMASTINNTLINKFNKRKKSLQG